jgi:hypothetical protein
MAVDVITELKKKVVKDFGKYIARLGKGYKDDYDLILHEISFIECYRGLDNVDRMAEFLIRN